MSFTGERLQLVLGMHTIPPTYTEPFFFTQMPSSLSPSVIVLLLYQMFKPIHWVKASWLICSLNPVNVYFAPCLSPKILLISSQIPLLPGEDADKGLLVAEDGDAGRVHPPPCSRTLPRSCRTTHLGQHKYTG